MRETTSWDVTANHSTMMRALMMDFDDKNALEYQRSIYVRKISSSLPCNKTNVFKNRHKWSTVHSPECWKIVSLE